MNWHVLTMRCPACNGKVVPVDEVMFRADRMVRIEGNCKGCGRRLFLEESWDDATPREESPEVYVDLASWQPKGKPN